jgi:hypothetical protein
MVKLGYLVGAPAAALTVSIAAGGAAATTTGPPSFTNVTLGGGQGGEPSIAIDTSPTSGRNDIYVGAIGDANGPLEWHSYNLGTAWSAPVPFDLNGPLRGGDDDLAVNTNGDLIATDLDVSHASVQISRDHGKTFSDGTITAPEDDRPWLPAPAWHVYMAQSRNLLSSTPTFTQVAANATTTHYGRICTNGLVCGSSDRSLLDFISVAVDCHGYAHIAYGANTKAQEANGQTFVRVANQTGGIAIAAPPACGVPIH